MDGPENLAKARRDDVDETVEQVDPLARTAVSDPPGPLAPAVPQDPLLGRELRHYKIDAPLGRGGMGAVYRAWDTSLERPVALKVLLADTEAARVRFLREARAQAKLRHPNVVPIHFVGESAGISFFAMEIVVGESLAKILERGPLDTESALDVVDVVAQALEAGHAEGLVHRDIKPSNILIERGGRVLLADFGLAKDVAAPAQAPWSQADPHAPVALTRAGVIVGTPMYIAPEQAAGGKVDFRADIYALGITLYETLTGQPPFTGETTAALLTAHQGQAPIPPRTLAPNISPALDALVMRMIAKSPEARFASYAELRGAIEKARTQPVILGPPLARGVAFGIDMMLFGVFSAVGHWLTPLGIPCLALVLGLVDGWWGRTPGKKWMRLRAVGPFDTPLGMRRALVRSQVRLWGPTMAFTLGYLLPRDGLWELLAMLPVVAWGVQILVGMLEGRRALHDRVAGTRVIIAIEPTARALASSSAHPVLTERVTASGAARPRTASTPRR